VQVVPSQKVPKFVQGFWLVTCC
ncbi:MAG: hypothetical protein RL260_3025, partial [Pseudomonadota bacterium]